MFIFWFCPWNYIQVRFLHTSCLPLFFSGVCLCVHVFLHDSQVINGQLVFSVTRGSTRPVRLRLDQVQVADGRWHDLQLELRDVRSGRETRYVATLRLDFGLYQVRDVIKTLKGCSVTCFVFMLITFWNYLPASYVVHLFIVVLLFFKVHQVKHT